jgi:RNA polymerase sigma-70 factor (ECF subfamily)
LYHFSEVLFFCFIGPEDLPSGSVAVVEFALESFMNADAPGRLVWFPAAARQRASAAAKSAAPESFTPVRDEDLLSRAQTGDSEAVAMLFDRFSRLVLSISMRILRDRGEAEDLVQDVFLHLCQKGNTFDAAKGSARTWMVQFAYRRALDRRSYLMRRHFYRDTASLEEANALEEARDFEESVATRFAADSLHAAFETLNEKQRATLELFFFGHCDLREAAVRLGETYENVRNYYYRGLRQLRQTANAKQPPSASCSGSAGDDR